MTSAEAAQYRAAGWWSDATLSDSVRRNATEAPDKPAYLDFTLDSADRRFTWSEFDNAATNLASGYGTSVSRRETTSACGIKTARRSTSR